MKILHLSDLKLIEENKPKGYVQDVISNSIENIDNEIFVLEDESYYNLVEKYRTETGVGVELRKMFFKVGININETLEEKMKFMNDLGVFWCEQNIDIILNWLEIEAKQRKIPFIRIVGKILLSRAIKNAKGKKI